MVAPLTSHSSLHVHPCLLLARLQAWCVVVASEVAAWPPRRPLVKESDETAKKVYELLAQVMVNGETKVMALKSQRRTGAATRAEGE